MIKMRKAILMLFALLLHLTMVNAGTVFTVYEDAEDGSTERWRIYDNKPSGAVVSNIEEDSNRIILLSGKKLLNGFIIGNLENRPNAWNDTQNNIVSWKMKYDERYKIHIRIETNNGPVYMFYTPSEKSRGVIEGKKNTYIHHGLGRATKNGKWNVVTRDLEADLKEFRPDDELISVNAFLIRGTGYIDDIKLGKDFPEDTVPPTITLNGEQTVKVLLHDSYEEKGAEAVDDVDGNIPVTITGTVDVHKEGTYTLTYSATDSAGNKARLDRIVNVVEEGVKLHATSHVLKTAYLSRQELEGDVTFVIDASSAEGNVTLLNSQTGRYTYLSSPGSENDYDIFHYTVTDENGVSVSTRVNVHMEPMKVILTENGDFDLDFSSNLPIVIIDTGDKEIPKDPKIKGSMAIIGTNNNSNRSSLDTIPDYSGYMEIEIRGSSSSMFPKKQYSVDTETWDEENDDVALLGMPEEHKWILYAPYTDKSLMRNYLAYQKTREVDPDKYYAVRSHYVELLVREDDHYRYDGVYVLMEKIKRDKNRVDIEKMKSSYDTLPKLSGGYIFKRDRRGPDEENVMTGIDGTEYVFVYPKSKDVTGEQQNYMESYIRDFETALAADDFNVSDSDNYYGKYIDVDAFIVHMLSREFFKDVDSWVLSEYMYKERSDKLYLSAVWDFNLGMGNNNYHFPNDSTPLWAFESQNIGMALWVQRLMEDPAFRDQVKTKWQALRNTVWSDSSLITFIDSTKGMLTESAERNFARWTKILGQYVWPNRKACTKNGESIYCDSFESAVNEHLKAWVLDRAHWMDGAL